MGKIASAHKWDKMLPGWREVLREQCKVVGVRPSDVDWTNPEWFRSHSWTEFEEARFCCWLRKELATSASLRKDLMEHPSLRGAHIEAVAQMWVFQYGWTTSRRKDSP